MKRFAWYYLIMTLLAAVVCGLTYLHNPSATQTLLGDVEKDFPTSTTAMQDKVVWQKFAIEVRSDLLAIFWSKPGGDKTSGNDEGESPLPHLPSPPPMAPLAGDASTPLASVLPGHPHWVWKTLDGRAYDDVVVTKIESATVVIMHANGVAHIDTSLLPKEILQELHLQEDAVTAERQEAARENSHPFYRLSEMDDARTTALRLQRPVAWLGSTIDAYSEAQPYPGSDGDLTQLTVKQLAPIAITVFLDGDADIAKAPSAVQHEFSQNDGDPGPDGNHFELPKIVFSDASGEVIFGRVVAKQLKVARELPLTEEVEAIVRNAGPLLRDAPPPATPPGAIARATNLPATNAASASLPSTGAPAAAPETNAPASTAIESALAAVPQAPANPPPVSPTPPPTNAPATSSTSTLLPLAPLTNAPSATTATATMSEAPSNAVLPSVPVTNAPATNAAPRAP